MTSPYISAISNITNRTLGPLNANKTPNITRVVNNGIVEGTPPQFFPQQTPINANMNTHSRIHYRRTPEEINVKNVYKDTSSSDRLRRLKSQSISNNMKSNSTKNVNQNDSKSALRRMRSSGYVVQKKNRYNK
jgi:hypothetical protein